MTDLPQPLTPADCKHFVIGPNEDQCYMVAHMHPTLMYRAVIVCEYMNEQDALAEASKLNHKEHR